MENWADSSSSNIFQRLKTKITLPGHCLYNAVCNSSQEFWNLLCREWEVYSLLWIPVFLSFSGAEWPTQGWGLSECLSNQCAVRRARDYIISLLVIHTMHETCCGQYLAEGKPWASFLCLVLFFSLRFLFPFRELLLWGSLSFRKNSAFVCARVWMLVCVRVRTCMLSFGQALIHVTQAGFEPLEILLSQTPEHWYHSQVPPNLLYICILVGL